LEKYVGERSDSVSFDVMPLKSVLKGVSSTPSVVGWIGNQSKFGRFREGKNLLPFLEIEGRFHGFPVRSVVTVPTDMYVYWLARVKLWKV